MSAINEWFGAYNMIFRHIKNVFGDKELEDYLEYLGDTAYSDICTEFRDKGLEGIGQRYTDNFIKDGGNADYALIKDKLNINVLICPAFKYMMNSDNPYDRPEDYFCDCCKKMNSRIINNSGYNLKIDACDKKGRCRWEVISKEDR